MKWIDVKKNYASSWLLIEAIEAHTEGENRIVDKIAVIDSFQEKSSKSALLRYLELHRDFPEREFYVVHSDRENLDIKEQKWAGLGVRASNEF
jgi:hypothetical protein